MSMIRFADDIANTGKSQRNLQLTFDQFQPKIYLTEGENNQDSKE